MPAEPSFTSRFTTTALALGLVISFASAVGPQLRASEQLSKTFEFGPGTVNDHSNFRTLLVPAGTQVSVAVQLQRDAVRGGSDVPVFMEVRQASADSLGATGPDGPLLATNFATATTRLQTAAFQNRSFVSGAGCPNTWRVRVATTNGLRPPVKVFGTIVFVFTVPGSVDVPLLGGALKELPAATTAVRTLDTAPIRQTGTFRMKAKWHTDPLDLFHIGQFFNATVDLLRPDGSRAAGETGFSQHAPATKTPKVDFTYFVTSQDAANAIGGGIWALRVASGPTVKMVDFNVKNSFDSPLDTGMLSFHSTFTPGCADPVGTFELTPVEAAVATHERLSYAFTWTVPEPLGWHDLSALRLRIRDGDDTVLSLLFDEASNTFSLVDDATGRAGPGFAAGRPNRLETPYATLYLEDTSVVGSGPTGPSVTLNLSLSFKPLATGRDLLVEVAAADDLGNELDVMTEAGTLTVTP